MASFIPSVAGQQSDGAERRVDPRRALRANAELVVATHKFEVRTLDISISGVGVASALNPPAGVAARLLLAPPDNRRGAARMELPVTVIHSILSRDLGEFKVGLRFGSLTVVAHEAVRVYLLG